MAHSLEGRVPFLDHRLVELLYGLDAAQLYERGTTKVVLRRALGGPAAAGRRGAARQARLRHARSRASSTGGWATSPSRCSARPSFASVASSTGTRRSSGCAGTARARPPASSSGARSASSSGRGGTWDESPDDRGQPAPVHQGGAALARARRRRDRGGLAPLGPALRRGDVRGLLRRARHPRADALLGSPHRRRRSARARDRRRGGAGAAGLGDRLRRHEHDGRGRPRRRQGGNPAGARRGRAPQRRPLHARGAEPDRGRPDRGPPALPGRGLSRHAGRRRRRGHGGGRRGRDGRCRADLRAARPGAISGGARARLLPRRDGPPRGQRGRATAEQDRGRAERPRGAGRLSRASAHARRTRSVRSPPRAARLAHRASRVPRARRARVAGARDPDRLRRAPEGGVLVRRPLRHAATFDGVGRHGARRREHARRRRSRGDRRRRGGRADAARAAGPLRRRLRVAARRRGASGARSGRGRGRAAAAGAAAGRAAC